VVMQRHPRNIEFPMENYLFRTTSTH